MGLVVIYLPQEHEKLSATSLWAEVRSWMKAQGLSWEKLRLTPDFFQGGEIDRQGMQGMLELVRKGQIDRVVYFEAPHAQLKNLDWLAFALTLQRYRIPLESFEGRTLPLESHLQNLTQGFDQLHHAAKTRSRKAQKSL